MKLKPSCLKGMGNMYGITKIEKFIDEKDSLSLEDSSGRVKIDSKSNLNIDEFVTGIPVAFKGQLNNKEIFVVNEYLFYRLEDKITNTPMDVELNTPKENQNLILFISNLKLGNPNEIENGLGGIARSMLVDFIQNNNLTENLSNISSRIKRVIFVGASAYVNDKIEELDKGSFIKAEEYKKEFNKIIENYTSLDKYLNLLSSYIQVDLMNNIEGNDGVYFPQNPNGQFLFLENIRNINAKTLNLVENPYIFDIYSYKLKDKKYFLGTSGENINCIMQYTSISEPLIAMEKTLEWGHLAPLAPDTFRIYPFTEKDPLLLEKIPDMYFISGKNEFKMKKVEFNYDEDSKKSVTLMELPDFSSTFKGIVYNIDDDSINEINFSQILSFNKN
jgi:DNA polymerase delta subunit 2